MTVEGVDYAWSVPNAVALRKAGKVFACRYGGPGSAGKQLNAKELQTLKAAGVDVVANAEGAAGGFRGRSAGVSWATQALSDFKALGMPTSRPIYFSVDWNATAADWNDIDEACRGAASVIGPARVGVYGGYNTISHCKMMGIVHWFWQTYAWSGTPTKWHPAAHIQQYHNGVTVAGATLDLDRAMVADYGQWGYKAPLPPAKDDFMSFITNRAQFQAEMTAWAKTPEGAQALLTSLMASQYGSKAIPTRRLLDLACDLHGARDFVTGNPLEADPQYSHVTPDKHLAQMAAVPAQVAHLTKLIEDLAAKI